MTPEPIRLAVIGAGDRGRNTYGRWCLEHAELARVTHIADPHLARRSSMASEHGIAPEATFADWRALLAAAPEADAIVVASPDREHAGPAIAALDRGYDVVLEKPIAPTLEEVQAVAEAAASSSGSVTVAHVLRYSSFFSTIRQLLDQGSIGRLVTITHAENVGYWHFAHSFVRGNWRNAAGSSPMILAKACHDLDLLRWLAGDRCIGVASFGNLEHFRPEEAPPGALDRCWDGTRRCPAAPECPFDAVRFYAERLSGVVDWPIRVISPDASADSLMEAIGTGPYGRCVYQADNDVVDNQVVALEFASGVRATLTVSGLTADNTRTIKLGGTRGEVRGRLDTGEIELRRFLPGPVPVTTGPWDRDDAGRAAMRGDERRVIRADPVSARDGHGGGDDAFMADVVSRLRASREGVSGRADEARTSLAASIESHLMAFAAEDSRLRRRMVDFRAG